MPQSKVRLESDGVRTQTLHHGQRVPCVEAATWEHRAGQVARVHLTLGVAHLAAEGVLGSMSDAQGRRIKRIIFEDGTELSAEEDPPPVD